MGAWGTKERAALAEAPHSCILYVGPEPGEPSPQEEGNELRAPTTRFALVYFVSRDFRGKVRQKFTCPIVKQRSREEKVDGLRKNKAARKTKQVLSSCAPARTLNQTQGFHISHPCGVRVQGPCDNSTTPNTSRGFLSSRAGISPSTVPRCLVEMQFPWLPLEAQTSSALLSLPGRSSLPTRLICGEPLYSCYGAPSPARSSQCVT